jgi:hypothetical protein
MSEKDIKMTFYCLGWSIRKMAKSLSVVDLVIMTQLLLCRDRKLKIKKTHIWLHQFTFYNIKKGISWKKFYWKVLVDFLEKKKFKDGKQSKVSFLFPLPWPPSYFLSHSFFISFISLPLTSRLFSLSHSPLFFSFFSFRWFYWR